MVVEHKNTGELNNVTFRKSAESSLENAKTNKKFGNWVSFNRYYSNTIEKTIHELKPDNNDENYAMAYVMQAILEDKDGKTPWKRKKIQW